MIGGTFADADSKQFQYQLQIKERPPTIAPTIRVSDHNDREPVGDSQRACNCDLAHAVTEKRESAAGTSRS